MYCKKCGGYNTEGRTNCVTCGHSLTEPVEPVIKPVSVPDIPNVQPKYRADDDIDVAPFLKEAMAGKPSGKPAKKTLDEVVSIPIEDFFADEPAPKTDKPARTEDKPARTRTKPAKSTEKEEINTYLIPSILVAVFCSGVFGIAALILSSMTRAATKAGEPARAGEYSERTRLFCWIGLAVGIVTIITVTVICAKVLPQKAFLYFPNL